MSSRPLESPPPYRPDEFKPNHYAPSNDIYGGEMHDRPMLSQPAYSFYPEDEILHFYKWTSPPGVIRILSMLIIVMCIAIFACVASTLAWDRGYGSGLLGGYPYVGSGFGSYGSSYGYGYGYGYGGGYTDPRAAKGFLLAMAAFSFIAALVIFVTSVIKSEISRTRTYYLAVIIASAILGIMVFIATIVYIMGVNPTAQASGSIYSSQIYALCNQFYTSAVTGLYMDQYLYHYCVVDPQEAIAIVLGFLVIVAFALIIFFAVKTRRKIDRYDKSNILWDKERVYDEHPPNVEEWVKNVSAGTQDMPPPPSDVERIDGSVVYSFNGKVNDKRPYPDSSYKSTPVPEVAQELPLTSPVDDYRQPRYSSSGNFETPSRLASTKGRAGKSRRTEQDHYDTDYTTGGESCDELEEDWIREYPPITSDQQRQLYKRSFDTGLQEYKSLQAELDEISKELSRLDKELDDYREESEEYMAAADEYNRLKQVKRSADYKSKRNYCKQLKSKLSHIKKMVGDYDKRKT
ncbi:occludin [Loxodonta africana]|uniref:occludin n=1 Tax=Loxodonta africana TaxID=9785 RepID=UPI0030D2AC9D